MQPVHAPEAPRNDTNHAPQSTDLGASNAPASASGILGKRKHSMMHAAPPASSVAMPTAPDQLHPSVAPLANVSIGSSSPEPQVITSRSPSPSSFAAEAVEPDSSIRAGDSAPNEAIASTAREPLASFMRELIAVDTMAMDIDPSPATKSSHATDDPPATAYEPSISIANVPSTADKRPSSTDNDPSFARPDTNTLARTSLSGSNPAQFIPRQTRALSRLPVHQPAKPQPARQAHPRRPDQPTSFVPSSSTFAHTAPDPRLAVVSSSLTPVVGISNDSFLAFLGHYATAFLRSPTIPQSESQRLEYVHRACISHDYFLLAVHQVACACVRALMQGSSSLQAECVHVDVQMATEVNTMFDPPHGVTAAFYFAWSDFPRPVHEVDHGQDNYAILFRGVAAFLKSFLPWRDGLRVACDQRQFPPLVDEMLQQTTSALFHRVIFLNTINFVWLGAAANLMDQALVTFEADTLNHRRSPDYRAANQIIIQKYKALFGPLSRIPRHLLQYESSAPLGPFLPQLNASVEAPAVPDPTMYGLHLSHLRDPPLYYMNHSSRPIATYQSINRFLVEPKTMDMAKYVQSFQFSLSESILSKRPSEQLQTTEGRLRPQRAHVGSHRVRLQCKRERSESTAGKAITMSEWVELPTEWPESSVISVNNKPIELRYKTQFGRCLPSDISQLLAEGENEIKIFQLASAARKTASNQRLKYTMALELVEVHSHFGIIQDVMTRTLPLIEAFKALVRNESSSDDDDIVHTKFTMSITDPISATAMWKTPVRGANCTHVEAFDLEVFLESRRAGKPADQMSDIDVWKCPICLGDARPDSLVPDAWLLSVRAFLESDNQLDARRIEVSPDGEWNVVGLPQRKKAHDAKRKWTTQSIGSIEVIELD